MRLICHQALNVVADATGLEKVNGNQRCGPVKACDARLSEKSNWRATRA
jgi:hypothetical protein